MIAGILSGQSLKDYQELASGSPIPCIQPPVVWLSSPSESVSEDAVKFITDNDDIEVNMDPVMFRNLYNPKTGLSGLYAACLPEEGSAFDLRTHFGVTAPDPTFVPSFLVVTDAMRSFNCRKFFRGFSGALCLRRLVFTLFIADENNPDHAPLFENYNSEVNHELGAYKMMWVPRQ